MKFVSYQRSNQTGIGSLTSDHSTFVDLTAATAQSESVGQFSSMLSLIDAGPRALDEARHIANQAEQDGRYLQKLSDVKLLPPLPEPRQMRDFNNFPVHIKGAPAGMQRMLARARGDSAAAAAVQPATDIPEIYKRQPVFYITNRFAISGPDAVVNWPPYSNVMDFEIEFGMILSRGGRDIPVNEASSHIFGYTIFNDFSARDTQMQEMQSMMGPSKGKSFDGSNVIGPWLVTKDEIPDPRSLTMSVRVNGEVWSTSNSSDMLYSFEEMIAYVSRNETLRAGELFGSGTVGNGSGLELGRFLKNGDRIEIEIDQLGTLRNTVSTAN